MLVEVLLEGFTKLKPLNLAINELTFVVDGFIVDNNYISTIRMKSPKFGDWVTLNNDNDNNSNSITGESYRVILQNDESHIEKGELKDLRWRITRKFSSGVASVTVTANKRKFIGSEFVDGVEVEKYVPISSVSWTYYHHE